VATLIPGATETSDEGTSVSFRVADGGAALPNLLRMLDVKGIALTSVEVHRPSLDDVFLSLTGRSLRDAPAA
jgi:ABC-2 type transport system ATP-binding protein